MSIYEYDQEKHIRMERQDAWEDGMQEGVLRGAEQQLSKIIKNMMKKGRSISQIAEELGDAWEKTRIEYGNWLKSLPSKENYSKKTGEYYEQKEGHTAGTSFPFEN